MSTQRKGSKASLPATQEPRMETPARPAPGKGERSVLRESGAMNLAIIVAFLCLIVILILTTASRSDGAKGSQGLLVGTGSRADRGSPAETSEGYEQGDVEGAVEKGRDELEGEEEPPEDPGEAEDEEDAQAGARIRAPTSLNITLAPLKVEDHIADVISEGYRVPDASFCGKILRAEPDQRTPEPLPVVTCRCRNECDALDFPAVSYIFRGQKSKEELQAAMARVRDFHWGGRPAASREFVVHTGTEDGLSFSHYLEALKVIKPGVKDKKFLMNNAVFLMRSLDAPGDDAQRAALARLANAPKVVVVEGQADSLVQQERRDVIEQGSDCGNELDYAILMQYFNRPSILTKLLQKLRSLPGKMEILVNNDSASELTTFQRRLRGKPFTLMMAGDIHEIRGYNRLAKLVHAKVLVVLQDDDLPPARPIWIHHMASAFSRNNKLGFIGGFTGTIQGGPMTGKYGVGRSRIKSLAKNKQPFMFVTLTNIGPFIIRQDLFLETGMFNMNYSCIGDPGIGFDYEFSLRTWWTGYQVALMSPNFEYHYGNAASTGTRANKPLYRRRVKIEKRNSAYHLSTYGPASTREFYFRQGLPGRPNARSKTLAELKGVGVLVHAANAALKSTPHLGGDKRSL